MARISAGSRHSAFITQQHEVFVCGANESGQLGVDSRANQLLPLKINVFDALRDDRVLFQDVQIGVAHSLLLSVDGQVYATGSNKLGQLGLGHKQSAISPKQVRGLQRQTVKRIACGHHSGALTDKGELYIWVSRSLREIRTTRSA